FIFKSVFKNKQAVALSLFLLRFATLHYVRKEKYTQQRGETNQLGRWNSGPAKVFTCLDVFVGIGTVNPQFKLEVVGDGLFTKKLTVNNQIVNTAGGYVFPDGSVQTSAAIPSIWTTTGSYVYVAGKKMGVGTSSPKADLHVIGQAIIGNKRITSGAHTNYKLAVDGKILMKEAVVTSKNWADFVFEPNYELRTIEEVEKYINENHHLPEVPTQEEIAENGKNLGDIDVILLQKLEELTLYVIELNNKNKELEARILELSK
ncbi:MAG: hypothetical protein JKY53_09580, partial [Flavobacteriales bacterium]|nr:hypothetical protein [Flavobacteriales bacterium]